MFAIELSLKGNPIPVTVERKEKDDAFALVNFIIEALESGNPRVLQLTCDKQLEKKVALLTEQISGVQVSEKNSSASVTGVGFGRY
ncbi:hypothetical protein Syn7502_03433 [Synechococcus sp. PCC 7502]|uniref:hypothetical protein n=1 Tax=Synechococcus sp. PCC 7502 TaxID=1173263 RepID=UPI00029F9922|nr:hypothetical protein [Synechococcus sp. PCC 7502]AFY75282.1 hypothetical protein Syn7502_03433 [Synechococcus sp. PCC 7502]